MASYIKDFGLIRKDGVKENNSFQMVPYMKENGKMIKPMDSEE